MNDIPAIMESLRNAPAILQGLVSTIPEAALQRKRCADCWTITKHILHLAQVQPMMSERVRRIIDEEHAVFVPFLPGKDESAAPALETDVQKSLQIFSEQRKQQVKMLECCTPEIWQKTATHPEYEPYGLYILARHIVMHDHWHMYRMEELWLTTDAYFTPSS